MQYVGKRKHEKCVSANNDEMKMCVGKEGESDQQPTTSNAKLELSLLYFFFKISSTYFYTDFRS